jgi:SSS family solute:Na+ symporter
MWGLLALMTLVLYSGTISNPDYVWGHATRDLLGPIGFGLVGLMIACLIAALMASKSAFMITAAALVTNNLYRPFWPHCSENHYIWVGRVFSVFYVLASAYFATQSKSLFGLFKMTMMFNCILVAAFWLGMLWRRANRAGAWTSMVVMFITTVVLPFGLPAIPGIRTSEYLLKTTNSVPVSRTYTAREMDVQEREHALTVWDHLTEQGKTKSLRPVTLKAGDQFVKKVLLPKKSVFWSEGLELIDGRLNGTGNLKVELIMLDKLGWDLSKNSYSLNETLTFLFRIIIPFIVLMLVALFTKPVEKERLDHFYGKMLTPVVGSHADDNREMALTNSDPNRFDHL